MMKILFVTDNFPPEVNAPATRTYEHCKEWVKLGVDVTVVTCFPNFPQGKVYEGYKNKLYQVEIIDGIKVVRVLSYITANKGFLKRTLDYFSFAITSFIAGLFIKCDIIIATSPQFFTTWSAFFLSKLKGKPWIFELRDLWPESIRTVGALKKERLLDLFEKIELFLYRDSAKVIAVTNAFKQNLIQRGIKAEKIEIITNGANLELFTPREKNSELIKELGLENQFIVGYIGTHGMAHGLDFIVNSIAKLDDNSIHFLFIGDGAQKEEIVKLAKDKNIQNITFLDPVPKEKIPEYLSIIDVSLVPLKKSDTFKTVIPSKIFEAAAMRKPILLGVEGQAKQIIDKYRAGLCFEPENEKEFLDKVCELRNNKQLYKELQKGCANLARDFDRIKLAKEMLEVIKSVSYSRSSDECRVFPVSGKMDGR
jgi:glycosyltransferase involved in cell wall biosynthesis